MSALRTLMCNSPAARIAVELSRTPRNFTLYAVGLAVAGHDLETPDPDS